MYHHHINLKRFRLMIVVSHYYRLKKGVVLEQNLMELHVSKPSSEKTPSIDTKIFLFEPFNYWFFKTYTFHYFY